MRPIRKLVVVTAASTIVLLLSLGAAADPPAARFEALFSPPHNDYRSLRAELLTRPDDAAPWLRQHQAESDDVVTRGLAEALLLYIAQPVEALALEAYTGPDDIWRLHNPFPALATDLYEHFAPMPALAFERLETTAPLAHEVEPLLDVVASGSDAFDRIAHFVAEYPTLAGADLIGLDRERAATTLAEAFDQETDVGQRLRLAEAYSYTGIPSEPIRDLLRQAFESLPAEGEAADRRRMSAVASLQRMGDTEFADTLFRSLSTIDPRSATGSGEVQGQTLTALIELLGHDELASRVDEASRAPDPEQRLVAAFALGQGPDTWGWDWPVSEAATRLAELMADPVVIVRRRAVQSLRWLLVQMAMAEPLPHLPERVDEALLAGLRDPDLEVRAWVADTCAFIGPFRGSLSDALRDALQQATEDPEDRVRRAARSSLIEYGIEPRP